MKGSLAQFQKLRITIIENLFALPLMIPADILQARYNITGLSDRSLPEQPVGITISRSPVVRIRVFPVSDKAEEIRQALLRYAEGAVLIEDGAQKLLLEPLAPAEEAAPAAPENPRHPKKKKPGPAYRCVGVRGTSGREYKADAVLVATGGLSYPTTGSTGDGYKLARQAGHTIVYRATEALLNYMEASYEKNGTLDGAATEYWKIIRRRSHVDEDFQKTNLRSNA